MPAKILEGMSIERFEEICKADREGRLIVLPVSVGTPTYEVALNCADNPNPTKHCFCFGKGCNACEKSFLDIFEIKYPTESIRAIVINMGLAGEKRGFGKGVYLTREEAQAALAKARGDANG